MKILFVDDHAGLQEKWIEPLRGEGWGVLRTKSTQDAEKIFEFHGDSLNALIVSEANAEWAGNWGFPYIVLMNTWKEIQVMKHQNSAARAASAYLDFDSNFELLKQAVTEAKGQPQKQVLKSTGTDFSSVSIPSISSESAVIVLDTGYSHSAASSEKKDAQSSENGVVIPLTEKGFDDVEPTKVMDVSTGEEFNVSSDVFSFLNGTEEPNQSKEKVSIEDSASDLAELGISLSDIPPGAFTAPGTPSAAAPAAAPTPAPVPQIELAVEFSSGDATAMEVIEPVGVDEIEQMEIDDLEIDEPEMSAVETSIPAPMYVSGAVDKDVETMKNYLALREQDVAVLTGQMRSAQERIHQLESQLRGEKAKAAEFFQTVQKQEQQIKGFERDKQVEFEVMYQQIEDLNLQIRERTDKTRAIETKLKIMTDEVEKVKERVRLDIRRIRVREKELESQLEILKKDSTALLVARDEKIVELKRKIDLLEFNMELVQEQYGKERNVSEVLRQKLKDAAGAVKRAGGLLDQEN